MLPGIGFLPRDLVPPLFLLISSALAPGSLLPVQMDFVPSLPSPATLNLLRIPQIQA